MKNKIENGNKQKNKNYETIINNKESEIESISVSISDINSIRKTFGGQIIEIIEEQRK